MITVDSRASLIDTLHQADLPKDVKRTIYFDVISGKDFARHNEPALRRNARNYPVYSISLPTIGSGITITGDLMKQVVKDAKLLLEKSKVV
mgnify:FL=1